VDSGENVTGITKGKTFDVLVSLLCLLIKMTFSPLCLHMGKTKVNSLYSSVKLGSQSSTSLSLTRKVNLSAKTNSFGDVAPRHLENRGQQSLWTHISSRSQVEHQNSSLKSAHYFSEEE
jgi:hypothetical protein